MKLNPKIAIIADAGRGTRFLPTTKTVAKSLIPVGNKPILLWILEEIRNAGIKNVIIVANKYNFSALSNFVEYDKDLLDYLKDKNKEYLLEEYLQIIQELNIEIVVQPKVMGYGTGAPLLIVSSIIGNQDFAYLYGDDLVFYKNAGMLKQMLNALEQYKDMKVVGVNAVQAMPKQEISKYGVIKPVKKLDDTVSTFKYIVEKPDVKSAPSNLASYGRYIFPGKFFDVLKQMRDQILSENPELFIQPAMVELAKEGPFLAVAGNDTKWCTTGDPKNLYIAWQEWYKRFVK